MLLFDNLLERYITTILLWLKKRTGKDNFFFAGVSFLVAGASVQTLILQYDGWYLRLIVVLAAISFDLVLCLIWAVIIELRRKLKRGTGLSLPRAFERLVRLRVISLAFMPPFLVYELFIKFSAGVIGYIIMLIVGIYCGSAIRVEPPERLTRQRRVSTVRRAFPGP